MRACVLILSLLILMAGCVSPTVHSVDAKANYGYVFGDVSAPEPTIIHSHVERPQCSVFGIFPLHSQYNGDWEFELVASSTWLDQVKKEFTKIRFADAWPRQVPDWFLPTSENFTACVAFCFNCLALGVYDGTNDNLGPIGVGEFDPARKKFTQMAKTIFPSDAEIQTLR
jgi:hypothetical protein